MSGHGRLQLSPWPSAQPYVQWLTNSPAFVFGAALLLLGVITNRIRRRKSNVPLYNPKKWWQLTSTTATLEFDANAANWIKAWFSQNDKPMRFLVNSGYCTILPSSMAGEFRKLQDMSVYKYLETDYHAYLPGFDAFKEVCRETHFVTKVVLNHFQTHASKYTQPMAEVSSAAVADMFGEDLEWRQMPVHQLCLNLITRTSAFVMVGKELSQNKEWLEISKNYAVTVAVQALKLRLVPVVLRPLAHWLSPIGKQLRYQVRRTRSLVEPVVHERRAEKAACEAKGISPPVYLDTLQWFEDTAKGQWYDIAGAQLAMDFAGIFTTTDLLTGALVDIARHPHLLELLRQEIRFVIGKAGWTPASLHKLVLLDSCLKETQRLKPVEPATMRSIALKDATLSDGTYIPKGELVAVAGDCMASPDVWQNPDNYDPNRFILMRQDKKTAANAQFENTNGDHFGFGWQPRACPGRFFATKVVKIILAQLLVRYDFKLVPGDEPKLACHSFGVRVHPSTKLMVRRHNDDG